MVNRKDFRPNSSSYSISDKDRETIRSHKTTFKKNSEEMERHRFHTTRERAKKLGFNVFRGGSGYRMSGIDAHGKHIQGEFITTSSVNRELDKIQHQKEQSVINREKEYRKEHGIKNDDDMYRHLKEGNSQYSPFEKDKLSEQEVNLLMRRINAKKVNPSKLKNFENGEGYELTEEQNYKGLSFLRNRDITPHGKERSNSPFGEREKAIIHDKNAYITLKDVYSPNGRYYYPYYEVHGNNTTMEYVYYEGEIHILG